MESIIEEKSFDFAIRIVNLYKVLRTEKKEFVLSKQLLRSGTSIGANVSEGERGQTKPDFSTKMSIALKEAGETYYWLRLLYKTNYLTEKEFKSMEKDIKEILALLTSICKTAKNNQVTQNIKC
ncbi:MAG: four helix bundle protein [Clostridia bacterium]|nr:four helix bundle protein [Clostridia bacterium]